ncbi:MAG: cytochrome c [Deltaproteobacteria bacterium]|nr:cytochrome c [Deltaproteobacteria bacterium]
MRWLYFILLQVLLIAIVSGIVYSHKDKVVLLKKPPQSLQKWYKPENKRQLWLHNMFKLRRQMQAVRFYAEKKDAKHLEKWATGLISHYLKIAEMVPEWKKKLDIKALSRLQKSVKTKEYEDLFHALQDLGKSCESCHADYRVITAAIYRAPDFSALKINSSVPLHEHMEKLTSEVNQIKIASQDGMTALALSSLSDLKKGIHLLGESCVNCHKKDRMVYPDERMNKTISSLEESLKTGTLKEQGRHLGTLAVLACARCHGVHRLSYDAGKIFSANQDWFELIKH